MGAPIGSAWASAPWPTFHVYSIPEGEPLGSQFGATASSAGDVNGDGFADVIVGDYGYDAPRGRAYLYFGGKKGEETPDFIATGESGADNMGYSVASVGDVNADGYDDVVVGAPNYSVGGVNRGRAYLYFGGPAMDNVADLLLTGEFAFDYFGYSVAGAGDVNHDGFQDFIVGAHGFGSERGRAYVFYGGTTPNAVADIAFTGRSVGDHFGFSVAGAWDVNGDNVADLLVGAPGYSFFAGRAYLFYGSPGSASADTTEDQVYTGQNTGDWFGTSASLAGDTDADGFADLIVGAPNYDSNRGRAYLFRGAPTPGNTAAVTMTGENQGDNFGFSVASLGDGNRDGLDDVIVGAPGFQSFDGKAYIYFDAAIPGSAAWTLYSAPWTAYQRQMGWSVAGAGDVDGDGYPDIAIGGPGGSPFSQNGVVWVESLFPYRIIHPNGGEQWVVGQKATIEWLNGSTNCTDIWLSRDGGTTWGLLMAKACPPYDPSNVFLHKQEVTIPGPATNTALIRLSYWNSPISQATSVVSDGAFQITDATVPSKIAVQGDQPKIYALGQSSFDTFGLSLAGGGDWNADGFADVAFGAPSSPGAGSPGRVYVYRGGAKADGIADVVLNGQSLNDEFGAAVAFAGDLNGDGFTDLAVGAPWNDTAGLDAGGVYVYFGGPTADGVADLTINGTVVGAHFGATVSGVGDVNGDGAADLLVGSGVDVGAGTTYLYLGGTAMDQTADLTLYEGAGFGAWISWAGDVNRDGYADWIIGSPSQSGGKGQAFVYYGGASLDAAADLTLSGGESFGQSVAGAGDLNGDGYHDLAVGEPGSDRAIVFLGGPSLDSAGNVALSGYTGGGFGTDVAGAGDVNGDSYPDLIVGEPFSGAAGPGMGRVQVYFGGPGMDGAADVTIATPAFGDNGIAGYRVARAGDFLGDGFSDLLVGAPGSALGGTLAGGAALYDVNRFHLSGPNGGETWQVGASKTISWYGSEPADLFLSPDGGKTYDLIASNVGGKAFNSLGILVPHTPTKFARVKLVPRNLSAPPNPIFPPNPVVPPNPVHPPSPNLPPSPIVPPSPNVAGGDQSDSLFTINTSVALLALMAAPAPQGTGAVITWNTDPGPEDLRGYRLEKATGSSAWGTLAALTRETRVEDPAAGPASRYRLFSVNGLNEELYLGETSFHGRAALGAWPLPYRGGKLTISFATSGGLGGSAGRADVGIFDVQGRLVRQIAAGTYTAGYQSVEWDGRDGHGRGVASGVYLIRSMSGDSKTTMKLVVAR
jgi:hypothetical protein